MIVHLHASWMINNYSQLYLLPYTCVILYFTDSIYTKLEMVFFHWNTIKQFFSFSHPQQMTPKSYEFKLNFQAKFHQRKSTYSSDLLPYKHRQLSHSDQISIVYTFCFNLDELYKPCISGNIDYQ